MLAGNDEEQVLELLTADRKRQREMAVRAAARVASFRSQVDVKLRKGLIQKARVKRGEYAIGEMVCFYRLDKAGTTSKRGRWRGPGLILGQEGGNWWISYAGRCHLVAEEHMRPSTAEELGDLFASRVARSDLEKLLFSDPNDPTVYAGPDHLDQAEPGDEDQAMNEDDLDEDVPMGHQLPEGDLLPGGELPPRPGRQDGQPTGSTSTYGAAPRRRRAKTTPGSEPYEALMLKKCKTQRSLEKQLEKELPWRLIPPEQHEGFKAAENKQINEHLEHEALRILTKAESDEVIKSVPPERILPSRWAYRDKNYSRRRLQPDLPWKPKSRLVVGGHRDPDVSSLVTDAPTVNRLSVLILMQILACHLKDPEHWAAAAGDVNAAFLNGPSLKRILYMRQPRGGVTGMEEGALFQIQKGIFGLPDSPNGWWNEVRMILDEVVVVFDKEEYILIPCPLGPCVYYLIYRNKDDKKPQAYICIHVDDLLALGPRKLVKAMCDELDLRFPIDDWEWDSFEYIGSHLHIDYKEETVVVSQAAYAASRLFLLETLKDQNELDLASEEQIVDNQSLIGGLSWLAGQTRPDLQAAVSMAQKQPSVADLKFSNATARKAMTHQDQGLTFRKINLDKLMVLAYHDSSWANATPLEGEDGFRLSEEDHRAGFLDGVPEDYQLRKARRASTKVASQYGVLILLSDGDQLHEGGPCNIIDWKSATAKKGL